MYGGTISTHISFSSFSFHSFYLTVYGIRMVRNVKVLPPSLSHFELPGLHFLLSSDDMGVFLPLQILLSPEDKRLTVHLRPTVVMFFYNGLLKPWCLKKHPLSLVDLGQVSWNRAPPLLCFQECVRAPGELFCTLSPRACRQGSP